MKIVLSGTLLRFVGYQRDIEVPAETVRSAIDHMIEAHPALRQVLLDGNGDVRTAHQLFVNGEQVGRALDREVADTDVLEVLTAIAGG